MVFVFIILLPTHRDLSDRMLRVESRISSMNDFVKGLERDAERGLYIASYRGILALDAEVIETGIFFANATQSFEEVVINGTINGNIAPLLNASTFTLWTQKIAAEAQNFNLVAQIGVNSVKVSQIEIWRVLVVANVTFVVEDLGNTARWNRTVQINSSIPIFEFEDPLYIVGSLGRTTNSFNSTPFKRNYTFLEGAGWNVTNLEAQAAEGFYVPHTDAPSFLMRFENDLTASPFGIESLVDLNKLSSLGLAIDPTSSIVDYLYWNATGTGDYRVNFTANWFRLDDDHRAFYNVTEISYED